MLQRRKSQTNISWVIGISGVALLLSISGCTVGPDFKEPQRKMPQSWVGATPTTAPTTQGSKTVPQPADVALWWKNFRDPELDSLVNRAMISNLDLKQAESRIREARAQRAVVAGGLWPQANLNANYTRSGTEGTSQQIVSSNGTVSRITNGGAHDLFESGLDASWEIDVFGGLRRGVEAADADILTAVEDRRDVLVTLTSEVALNYIDYRGLQQELVIARENLVSQKHSADVTRRRQQGGFISGLDVANADALVASTESTIPIFEQEAQQAIYDLALLLGLEPDALLKELTAPEAIPPTPPEIPIGLPSDLMRRRPDIRRAEAQLHAATARVGVATADLFPKFSLTGSLITSGEDAPALLNWNDGVWSLGGGLTYPLFAGGSIRANIKVQNEVQAQAATIYEQAVLTALHDVESALVAYAREQQHRVALAEAVVANKKAVDLATQLYTDGQTDFLNVVSAQRSLYASQDALVQSDRTMATNLVALYKSLGGGWEASEQTPPTTRPVK